MLPALTETGVPALLGASAHHLPTTALRDLGGWDPFNVTAEADLGARLGRAGRRLVVLDSVTSSAAPERLGPWLTQSARASKGLLLTALVQLRHPGRLVAQVGVRAAASLTLSLAGVVALLLHPLLWAAVAWWAGTRPAGVASSGAVPDVLGVVALTVLVLGNLGFGLALLAGSLRRGDHGAARAVLLAPLCTALLSLAAWRGLALLVAQPFRWERDPAADGVAA